MRQSKAQVYAKYGIRYHKGRIEAPEFGMIAPLLVNGNKKIGKGCYHFSMLPTNGGFSFAHNGATYEIAGTCCCTCRNDDGEVTCYATKGNYNFPSVRRSLGIKTFLARHHLDFVRRAIMAQIEADRISICRVHVAGDFFSSAYVDMWREIAQTFPGVTFWTYTKVRTAEGAFDDIRNFNVVKSLIPGHGFNYGNCAYIIALYEALRGMRKRVYICRCGIDETQHCFDCGACRSCDYVLFLEHSTKYNAQEDALFPVLKCIIESQDDSFRAVA